MFIFLDWR